MHCNAIQTRAFKHEIRISKHETNYNDQMTKILNKSREKGLPVIYTAFHNYVPNDGIAA